jgi:hypothetical protein
VTSLVDDNPAATARWRPRGGSNSPHLIDSQAASPEAYEGKKSEFPVTLAVGAHEEDRTPVT